MHELALGDWVVRRSGGATKRVNSVNPLRPGARVEAVRAIAEDVCRDAGLPVRFRLNPLAAANADALLAAAGYALVDPSWTMIAPLGAARADEAVSFGPPDPAWRAAHALASGWDEATREAHAASLARLPACAAAATLTVGGRATGFAIVAIAGGWAQLYDVVVLGEDRGRGHGERIVRALLHWARAHGAAGAALQVLAANLAARRLYARLGFTDAYPYHYRVRR